MPRTSKEPSNVLVTHLFHTFKLTHLFQPNPKILEQDLIDLIIHMKSLSINFEDLDLFVTPGN